MQPGATPVASERDQLRLLKTEVEAAASDANHRLEQLTNAALDAQLALREQISAAMQHMRDEFDIIAKRSIEDADKLDRATRALTVRALEIDNRALQLEQKQAANLAAQKKLDNDMAQRTATLEQDAARLREKEITLAAREASLRYSAVEQNRLQTWSKELQKRENRIGEAEEAEKERISARVAAVAKREILVDEKERRIETTLQERELTLARMEAAVDAMRDNLNRQRAEAMLQLEAERSHFWAHQQKLSAIVAAETDALLAEQAKLREEFDKEADAARKALTEMSSEVLKMRVQIEQAQSPELEADSLPSALEKIDLAAADNSSTTDTGKAN